MIQDSKEKLRVAILRILNSNSLRIFGCIIYNFDIKVISIDEMINYDKDSYRHLTAFVSIIENKALITIFESFIQTKTIQQLIFIILHEIMHIIFGHHLRSFGKDSEFAGLAADHVINTSLINDLNKNNIDKIEIPDEAFYIHDLKYNNLTFEEVYQYLIEKSNNTSKKTIIIDTSSENISLKSIDISINDQIESVVLDIVQNNQNSEQEISQVTESLKSEIRSIINNNIIKGNTSGEVFELIKKMVEIEIPWTTLLDRAICSKIIPADDNKTWKTIQKRPYACGFILPGYDIDEKPSELIIVEDQSGSINNKDIEKFASVIFQSLKYFDTVRIMKHDVKIHSDIKLDSSNVVTDDILFKTFGRGGTSHKYIFDKIEEYMIDDESDISLVILLTDFESDIERIWNKYEWPKIIPISVVLISNKNIVPTYIDPNPIFIK